MTLFFRYLINFLLDSTLGLFIVFIGIKISQFLARRYGWHLINFGEYGKFSIIYTETFILIDFIIVYLTTHVLS